jgi:hypothetical protein
MAGRSGPATQWPAPGRPPGRMPRRPRELDPPLTPAQLGVLAVESLADPGLERPSGVVPTPLAEALARSRSARPGAGAGPARAEAPGPAVRGLPGRVDG